MKMNGMSLLPEDIFTVFGRLGFSRYEAKVYATLRACGRLKMWELAKYSTVPQSKVYVVVESLEEKGTVVVSRTWTATAESVSLKQIVSARIRQYLQDAHTIAKYVESIQNTEAFKHFYHTHRIGMRSNGRLSLPSRNPP
jgi:sugar-specific transcriptional regulator TrmB